VPLAGETLVERALRWLVREGVTEAVVNLHHRPESIAAAVGSMPSAQLLGTALSLFMKTLPYALVRFGILVAVSVITIIWYALTFGGAALLGG